VRTLVIVPTYNEAANVELMLRALAEHVPDAHVLVVDDASPDGTGQLVTALSAELVAVTLLSRDAKNGLGGAYRAGFAWGLERGYDRFVEIDCDFSHDPAELALLLDASRSCDVVIGSRYIEGSSIPEWPRRRLALSRGGNLYASKMLGLGVHDATAGYRVYSREVLEAIDFEGVRADGYGFQVEMTMRARESGASIVEVPITFRDRTRGTSKMSSAIVVEAFLLVTRWGVERRLRGDPRWSISPAART